MKNDTNQEQSQEKRRSPQKFIPNNQYFTISIYALIVIAAGALIIRVIMTPHAVSDTLKNILNVLMPFLIGLLICLNLVMHGLNSNKLSKIQAQIKRIKRGEH